MEENKGFRLKLNLFDGIVILLALAVAAVLLYMNLKPAAPAGDTSAPAAATTQYTIRLQKTLPGTGDLIESGDALVDVVKNFEAATGVKIPYVIKDRRPGDIATCYADPAKAKEELGWEAQYGIKEMCEDAWRWQSNNPNGYEA